MVSLENRSEYLSHIKSSDKLNGFFALLSRNPIAMPIADAMAEINSFYFKIIQSISLDNKSLFSEAYNVLSRREPSKESSQPYIHDDLLIFVIITGVLKFGLDTNWIKKVVASRTTSINTTTFSNLLSDDFYSKNNAPEITICLANLLDKNDFPKDFLNNSYLKINNNSDLMSNKSDINIITSIKAVDLIITLKDIGIDGGYSQFTRFQKVVINRIIIIIRILYATLLIGLLFGASKLFSLFPDIKQFIDKYANLLTVLAFFGAVGGNFIPLLRNWFVNMCLIGLGFPQSFINKQTKIKR